MKLKYLFQNIAICISMICSLSGMPTMGPTESAPSLADNIKGYKNQTTIPTQITYLKKILSENQSITIPKEAQNAFKTATMDIWNQSWALKSSSDFGTLQPLYINIINFFTSIPASYSNFIIDSQFQNWLNMKATSLQNWVTQTKKEIRQEALKKGRRAR